VTTWCTFGEGAAATALGAALPLECTRTAVTIPRQSSAPRVKTGMITCHAALGARALR